MKKKIYSWLATTIAFAFFLQGCVKDEPNHGINFKEDKLLLSKVTGNVQSQSPYFYYGTFNNSYTYNWLGLLNDNGSYDSGNFQINYSYGQNKNGWGDYKPISQQSFINTGHYDFSYNGFFPDKVVDNSSPGNDFGDWKFYYNSFNQVSKVGLAYSTPSNPVQWEFYTRDNIGRISGYTFGVVADTFRTKIVYQYDQSGDLSGYAVYLPYLTYSGYSIVPNPSSGGKQNNSATESKHQELINKTLNRISLQTPKAASLSMSSISSSAADTISYFLYYTAAITTDHRVNPFSQQGNIFYYQTNRLYSLYDPTPFYLSLLKSNALTVEYQLYAGQPTPLVSAVQTFSYTYNKEGYPVSVHESFTDDAIFNGSYTRDSKIEYIKND